MLRNPNEKIVRKPWGNERWLADGTTTPYAMKRILFQSGQRSSLQVHEFKVETNYVLSGHGTFLLSRKPINVQGWLIAANKTVLRSKILEDLQEIALEPEMVIDVPAGFVHRVIANTDLIFIECSTTELDDVVRIEDDLNRGNGRINSEHR